jgi:GNAT superfamily N-acetyltransferase
MMLDISVYFGSEITPFLEDVAKLRIQLFREFPYLYEGTSSIEEEYLRGFSSDPKSMLVVARSGKELASVSTAWPFTADANILKLAKQRFGEVGIRVEDVYYYGEILVKEKFRGRGITRKSYELHEAAAKDYGYSIASIATVVRSVDDPRRPLNYIDTDALWGKLGFSKTNIIVKHPWPTIQVDGTSTDELNPMVFWTKQLREG